MCKMEGSVGQGWEKLKENVGGIQTGRIKDTLTWEGLKDANRQLDKDWGTLVKDIEGMGNRDYHQDLHDSWQKGVEGNIFNKQAWTLNMSPGGGGNPFDDDTDDDTTTITDTSTGSGTSSGRDALDPAMLRIQNKMGKTDTKREMLTKTARKGPGLRI